MLFTSHIHGYYRGKWGKTPFIITGGAGSKLAGNDPEHHFHHYIKVSVADNKVNYKVVRLKASGFGSVIEQANQMRLYVPRFFTARFSTGIIILGLLCFGSYIIYTRNAIVDAECSDEK